MRIVAPIIGAYPILSVVWAVLQGTRESISQILAIMAIIIGIALMATLADNSEQKNVGH